MHPTFQIEKTHTGIIAGVDEAGRGPWAGPVVAAAVILDRNATPPQINDSKKLSATARDNIWDALHASAQIGVGIASREEIDSMNILQATKTAMHRAIVALPIKPDLALIDGNQTISTICENRAIVKGDSTSLSIAAASIIAKVTRDRIMQELAKTYPGYGWESNAGYGTKQHQEGLARLGVTPEHRRSFAPIRKLLEKASA